MTTVLFVQDRVYADSTVYKGSERLDCITKIQSFDVPFKILSTKEDYLVDDTVHGYSGTGSQPAMQGLVEDQGDPGVNRPLLSVDRFHRGLLRSHHR